MLLNTLTPQQTELMHQVRDQWLAKIFTKRKIIDRQAATDGINELYKLANLAKPMIIFADSPLAAQYAVNILDNRDNAQVRDQVYDQVKAQVRDQVKAQVRDQVRDQVLEQVYLQVRDQVNKQVYAQVYEQVDNQAKNKFYSFGWYGRIDDFGWVACAEFYTQIGIVKSLEFVEFKKLLESGIYNTIQLKGLCVVSSLPATLIRDNQNRLHSDEHAAIGWSDGYEQYYLHGVYFERELWQKIVNKELSFKDAMAIENIAQRMLALKYLDADVLLTEANAELLSQTTKGNQLWVIKKLFNQNAYFLRYVCPSTSQVYISGVDPEVGKEAANKQNADIAMAWKHNMSLEQYNYIRIET